MGLHQWIFGLASWRERQGLVGGEDNVSSKVVEESVANIGATIMGRNMFGGRGPWEDEPWNGWLMDEMQLHLVPILLGDGTRLFDNLSRADVRLECTRVVEAPGVTHLTYRVLHPAR